MKSSKGTATQTEQDWDYAREELLEKAWDYAREELFEKADEAFTRALGLDPTSSEAFYGQALCLRKLNKTDEARRKLEDLRELDPGYAKFLVKEALLYIDQEQYHKAIEPFVEANDKAAEVRNSVLRMIASLRSQLPFQGVERIIEEALKYFPADPGIRSEYGWLHYTHEQYGEAIEKFDEVLQDKKCEDLKANKYKDHESALQGKIASLRLQRQFQKAYDLLQDPIKLLPDHHGIQSELGWLLFDQKQYDKAFKIFEEVYNKGSKSALQWIISCFRSQRDFTAAEEWLRKALEELTEDDPARIGIQNERGWLLSDKKHYVEASNAFDEALRIDERNEFALQGKIASLRLQCRFPEADELIKKALEWHPTSTGVLSERGWLLFDQKQYSEADASFTEAIKLAPNRIDLKFSRVEILGRMNRSYEADKILQELKRKFPDDIEVMEKLGRFYIHQRDLRSAEKEFLSILRKDAHNISGLGGLGAVYVLQARYEEAIENFRKVLQVDKYNPAWYANLAWALVRQEGGIEYRQWAAKESLRPGKKRLGIHAQENAALSRLDEAEEQCEKALEFDSESAEAYGCLGTIAFKRGNLRFSEEYLRTSIEKDLQKGNCVGLGALYVQMGRYDEAEQTLKKALFSQDDFPAHVELGNLYLKTGKPKEAIQEFRQAMAIDPNEDDPPRALAIALMQVNELNEAEAVLRDALRRLDESKRWRLHLTCSQLLTKRGDETEYSQYYNEAFKEAKKAIKLKPNHADPYFEAGFIRAKLKDYKGARKYFRSCLSQDEHHDEAESNLIYVQSLIREEKERSRSSFWAGFCVGALAVSQLILLWYFFKLGKVTETILTVLLPILLGLVVVAFLIPVLYKLKLPGLEAELRERKEPVSSGPKGEIVFSGSPPTISSGPR